MTIQLHSSDISFFEPQQAIELWSPGAMASRRPTAKSAGPRIRLAQYDNDSDAESELSDFSLSDYMSNFDMDINDD